LAADANFVCDFGIDDLDYGSEGAWVPLFGASPFDDPFKARKDDLRQTGAD
jgi:hypothetical protein